MKVSKNSKGFAVFEMILIVGVVGILTFAGWTVYNRNQDKKDTASTSSSQTASSSKSDVASAPDVKTSKDLDTAQKTLDGTNVESSTDDTQLDQDLASF